MRTRLLAAACLMTAVLNVPAQARPCPGFAHPALPWANPRFPQGVWKVLRARWSFTPDRWDRLCESEQWRAALSVAYNEARNFRPDVITPLGLEQAWLKKHLKGYSEGYVEEFNKLYEAYERRVAENRLIGWGYGWAVDFREPGAYISPRFFMPLPVPQGQGRPQGLSSEWAEDVQQFLGEDWRYWGVNTVSRHQADSHEAVLIYPKLIPIKSRGETVMYRPGNYDDGIVLDPWINGKAEIYDLGRWQKGEFMRRTDRAYANLLDAGYALKVWRPAPAAPPVKKP